MRNGIRATVASMLLVAGLAAGAGAGEEGGGMKTAPGTGGEILVFNEDSSHFFYTRDDEEMTRAGLQAWVDRYAGTKATHLFLCTNCQRANFASETKDPIWAPYDGGKDPTRKSDWPRRAKLLHERGVDPNSVRIERCREQGISPWLTIRMNDMHDVNKPGHWIHSTFWREHPEYWLVPHAESDPYHTRALDYAHEEVRAYQMAFIREVLSRYDPDGIELDWMRFGLHFAPGEGEAGAPVLTEFMRQVRALVAEWSEKRGHPIGLAARVPVHPDAARGLGMDGVTWAREGLVDVLTPTPFWQTADYAIPLALWRERLGPAAETVTLLAGYEKGHRAYPFSKPVIPDLPLLYGFVSLMQHRGADGIYLFNWMDREWDSRAASPVSRERYGELLQTGVSPAAALARPRRYPVTYHDLVPKDFPNGVQLPLEGPQDETVRLAVAPRPQEGAARLVLGLGHRRAKEEPIPGIAEARVAARLNGTELTPLADLGDEELPSLGGVHKWWGPERHPARGLQYAVPLAALREGENEITLRQTAPEAPQRIVWVEVRITPPAE